MSAARKVDGNQSAIVDALRDMGAFVFSLHAVGRGCPDLLVAFRGRWYVAEVKNGSLLGWKLTKAQKDFRKEAKADVVILTSVDDAIAWIKNVSRVAKPNVLGEVAR